MRKATRIATSLLFVTAVAAASNLSAVTITGNTGPGGVGRTDIASSLLYWLEADEIGVGDGNPVTTWSDTKTFSANDFTQGNNDQKPLLVASGINGYPVVSFDGVASPNHDKLVLGTSTSPRTIIAVNEVGVGQTGSCCVGLIGIDGGDFGIRRNTTTPGVWRGTFVQSPGITVSSDYAFPVGSTMHINGADTNVAAEGFAHILSASRVSAATFATTGLGDYFLAAGARRIKATVGEVIAYDTQITNTQRVLIENYLGAKFGIVVTGDVYASTDYNLDVFGIGNDSATAVTSSGSHGLGIEDATLGNNEWVLAGHKVETNSVMPMIEGGFSGERWERVWNIDTNGSSALTTLAFDFDDADVTAAFNASDSFSVLYSGTNAFSWDILSDGATVDVGNKLITFDLSGASLADGFYTLGINAAPAVPEPSSVTLLVLGVVGLMIRSRRRRN